jgi:hypothetical protein
VNVGLPRLVRWNGREVRTWFLKNPVEGRIPLHRLNLEGNSRPISPRRWPRRSPIDAPDWDNSPKEMGVAVLLDTLLVRLLLLPAVLRVFGPAAWWMPRLLDRLPQGVRLRHG